MKQPNSNELWFGPLFLIAGYGLLAWSFLDIADIFIPPRFTNPVWELQMAINLVERAPVPLLGLVLVLLGEQNFQSFRFLSRACLVVGILYILLMPLAINSAWRIDRINQQQLAQQITQIQELKAQLNQANTAQELGQIVSRLNPQATVAEIKNPQFVKNQLLTRVAAAEKQVQEQEVNQANNRLNLLKNAVKSVLGALVAGVVFLIIWRKTVKVLKMSR